MKDPIIVTGSARSGTSLTAGCLWHCGLSMGRTCGPTAWNERGQFENRELIQTAQKAYLREIGADPAAQHPLPSYGDLAPDPTRRDRVLEVVRRQGVDTDAAWGFKDAKALVDWPVWVEAFPEAVWVVTWRPREDVVSSCLRTRFMRAHDTREAWRAWWDYHEQRALDLVAAHPGQGTRVATTELAHGRMDEIRAAVELAGLSWNERRARQFVSPELWHFREGDDAQDDQG